jgi:hypothetical protein
MKAFNTRPNRRKLPNIVAFRHWCLRNRRRTASNAARTREKDGFDLAASPTSPELASEFKKGCQVVLADATHFIAMEEPDLVADEIRKLM